MRIWLEYVIYKLSVETIPTCFRWLTCRKQELVQSKNCSDSLDDSLYRQVILDSLGPLLNVYFNDMQIKRWLRLSSSLRNSPLPATCSEKECTRKFRHTGIPGLWKQVLDAGLWTLDSGRCTLGSGCWTLGARRWTLDAGL